MLTHPAASVCVLCSRPSLILPATDSLSPLLPPRMATAVRQPPDSCIAATSLAVPEAQQDGGGSAAAAGGQRGLPPPPPRWRPPLDLGLRADPPAHCAAALLALGERGTEQLADLRHRCARHPPPAPRCCVSVAQLCLWWLSALEFVRVCVWVCGCVGGCAVSRLVPDRLPEAVFWRRFWVCLTRELNRGLERGVSPTPL